MQKQGSNLKNLSKELFIPLIFFVFLSMYWWQAASLSGNALAFPAIITVSVILLIVAQLVTTMRQIFSQSPDARSDAKEKATTDQNRDAVKANLINVALRVSVIAIVTVLMIFWRELGSTLMIYTFLLSTIYLMNERSPVTLIFFPAVLTVGFTYLFQVVLNVIFSRGIFSIF